MNEIVNESNSENINEIWKPNVTPTEKKNETKT